MFILHKKSAEEISTHNIQEPLPHLSPDDYDAECKRHEHWCVVESAEMHRRIRFNLIRRHNFRGCGLFRDMPEYNGLKAGDRAYNGLKAGDRLEPTPKMLDTIRFDGLKEFPTLVQFWRATRDERAYHRNPLIDPSIGTSLHTFSIDILHCLHLGFFKAWASSVVWTILLANIFNVNAPLQDDRVRLGLQQLQSHLNDFYREQKRAGKKDITTIGDLTPGMIGTRSAPTLSTKAAETKWFVVFLVQFLPKCLTALPAEAKP